MLVVEDHADTRFMLRTMLEIRGFSVVEVEDGEQAIVAAERTRPDLVLMDGSLPLLDGLSAVRRMRELATLSDVPIVFLSGHADHDFQKLAFDAGCDHYLVKPLVIDQLDRILGQHLFPIKTGNPLEATSLSGNVNR